jgi:hypothetical protein
LPTKKKNEYEGGDGLLLANTFTKAGKPPDNTPAMKAFVKLAKTFDAIEAAAPNRELLVRPRHHGTRRASCFPNIWGMSNCPSC